MPLIGKTCRKLEPRCKVEVVERPESKAISVLMSWLASCFFPDESPRPRLVR